MDSTTWTWEDIEEKSAPPTSSVRICLRSDVVAELERLDRELRTAIKAEEGSGDATGGPSREIAERMKALEAEAEKATVTFVFRSIGRKAWADLQAQHLPTQQQRAQGADWNPETFPPAAIAASLIEPAGVTPDRVRKIYDTWSLGQTRMLWSACLDANIGDGEAPKAVLASAVLAATETRSEPPATTDFPAASS